MLVNDIRQIVQTSGVMAGIPMAEIVLQGCAVGCPWCYVKQTWSTKDTFKVNSFDLALGESVDYADVPCRVITSYIDTMRLGPRWAIITGGEPCDQDLSGLVSDLHSIGRKVALETSGVSDSFIDSNFDFVCVSPKINMPGGQSVLLEALAVADEIRLPVEYYQDITRLNRLLSKTAIKPDCEIVYQPLAGNKTAKTLAYRFAVRDGRRLSF